MKNPLNHIIIIKSLDWAYEKALEGIPGLDSSIEMAENFMKQEGSLHDKANSLIRRQNAKAATSGFLTGIGGFLTLPVAVPANLASVLYIQIRMIAAIAHMGGYNLRDEKVKTMVYICMAGNFTKDILQEVGIRIGTQLTAKMVTSISERSLVLINQKIGFRLLCLYSGKGLLNLSKVVPLAGGIIGGSIDIVATNIIGKSARNIFLAKEKPINEIITDTKRY
jgi:hypothetical protein